MGKSTKKTQRQAYDQTRALVVKKVSRLFNVTESYVRSCINNNPDAQSETAEQIRLKYRILYKQISEA